MTPERIAFVHIPKTAGVSVIHAFEHALGAERCASFQPTIDDAAFDRKRFVSGHVHLSVVTPNAFTFTFLREPVAQLASHLRWLDRYNRVGFTAEALVFSPTIRAAISRAGQTDFASARSIAAFFDWLPDDSGVRLRDVQCEVLAADPSWLCPVVPAVMAEAAIEKLARLDFVGVVDHAEVDMKRLFARLDLPGPPRMTRRNTLTSERGINLADPAIRAALEREVQADLILYRYVLAQRAVLPSRRRRWFAGSGQSS
jgi:hypothetical protein